MKKIKWTKSEIRMLLFSSGISLLFVGLNALYQWNNRVPELVIRQAAPPSPNAFDFLQDAAAAYVPPPRNGAGLDSHIDNTLNHSIPLFSAEYSRRYPVANKLAFLKTNAKALRLLRQGLKCEYLQPPERDSKDKADYNHFRDLARLLLLESHAHAQAGNWNAAADSLLDCLHLGYEIPRGGPLRAGLNGTAIRTLAIRDFKAVLPNLSAAKARYSARRIETWQSSQLTTAQSLEEEKRAMQGEILELIRSRDFRPLYVSYDCIGGCNISDEQYQQALNALPTLLKMRLAWINKPRLLSEYSRCMDWQIAQAKKPYPQQDNSWPFPEADEGLQYLIYPQYSRSSQQSLRCQATNALLFTMLALRAFHLENHRYPKQLSELVPKYLARVPLDPFSNRKPLRYRLTPVRYIIRTWGVAVRCTSSNSGAPDVCEETVRRYGLIPFTLYSIGMDARDDGATPYSSHDADEKRYVVDFHLPDTAKADIVAGIN